MQDIHDAAGSAPNTLWEVVFGIPRERMGAGKKTELSASPWVGLHYLDEMAPDSISGSTGEDSDRSYGSAVNTTAASASELPTTFIAIDSMQVKASLCHKARPSLQQSAPIRSSSILSCHKKSG